MMTRFEQFTAVISGINRYVQKLERDEMIKRGYKGAFAQYLAVLRRYEEGLTSGELCEVCDKDKAAVSRIIAEMEEKALVERNRTAARTYRTKIVLTEKGRSTADYVAERAKAAISAVSDGVMDENQREVFYSTLDVLYKNLQKVSREGIPQGE